MLEGAQAWRLPSQWGRFVECVRMLLAVVSGLLGFRFSNFLPFLCAVFEDLSPTRTHSSAFGVPESPEVISFLVNLFLSVLSQLLNTQPNAQTQEMELGLEFKDCLPVMAEKLGERGLMQELAKGFELLADPLSHTITFHSLKRSTTLLGLAPMSDCELREMINLGDSSGRGELDLHDFCVAMVRTSPELMDLALSVLFQDISSEKESCTSR